VTFYYGGDPTAASLLSTRVLLSSLRRTGTQHPVVVVVPPSVPTIVHDVLATEGALVTALTGVTAPDLSSSLTAQALAHFRNKLLLWSLTEYRRLVLLDHDDLGG
jgi:alpha-N-acetylglucosamine transferase